VATKQLREENQHLKLRSRRRVVCSVAFTLATALSLRSESDTALYPKSEPIPASYFSMNILFHPLNPVPWPAVPIGGWRAHHVDWANLQPEKDHWYFDLLDKYVGWSEEHHTPIFMPLTYTPRWASSNPDAPTDVETGNPPGLSGPPRDMEDWRIFVRTVATRYKGRIHDWELWNEPNRPQSWTGSVDTMVQMTKEASEILKEVDPQNIVVSPVPEEEKGLAFLDKFLSKGGGQYCDVIGYHFYVGTQPPEAMVPLIDKAKAIMQKDGVGSKPLWNTEAGWLGGTVFSPDLAAAYVARAYILNWAAGVSRFYWFAWEIHPANDLQMTEKDNATLAPAGKAFAAIQRWLTGAVIARCASSADGTWVCDLQKDGSKFHIVWNTQGDQIFPISKSWHANQAIQLSGTKTGIQGDSIKIGVEPELIQ
jgi:hypothetical protein